MKGLDDNSIRPALGRKVGVALSWTTLSAIYAKVLAFLSQIALGYFLTDEHWGTYAIAISLATLLMALRDGGAYELLVQRGPEHYQSLVGPVFWLGLTFNGFIAAALWIGSGYAAQFYNMAELAPVLQVLAASTVLQSPAMFARARLRAKLDFRTQELVRLISSLLQSGGAVIFAINGFGALSFVLPLPIIAVFETVVFSFVCGDIPWHHPANFGQWNALLRDIRWLLVGALATVTVTMGDYLVLGRLVDAHVLGTYYFAFQLSTHVSMLAAGSAGAVLLPALTHVRADTARLQRAVTRALHSFMLISAPTALGLVTIVDPLQAFLWEDRWLDAVRPTQIISFVLPMRLTFMIAAALLKVQGRFRSWAMALLIQGGGLMLAAAFAGWLGLDPTGIALITSLYLGMVSFSVVAFVVRSIGLSTMTLTTAILPSWGLAVATAAACMLLDLLLTNLPHLLRLVIVIPSYPALYLIACRAVIPGHLTSALSILPKPLARLAQRVGIASLDGATK